MSRLLTFRLPDDVDLDAVDRAAQDVIAALELDGYSVTAAWFHRDMPASTRRKLAAIKRKAHR